MKYRVNLALAYSLVAGMSAVGIDSVADEPIPTPIEAQAPQAEPAAPAETRLENVGNVVIEVLEAAEEKIAEDFCKFIQGEHHPMALGFVKSELNGLLHPDDPSRRVGSLLDGSIRKALSSSPAIKEKCTLCLLKKMQQDGLELTEEEKNKLVGSAN